MIYYLFSEKERRELEALLLKELGMIKELLQEIEGFDRAEVIKRRALKEKRDILLSLICKVTNFNQKKCNL